VKKIWPKNGSFFRFLGRKLVISTILKPLFELFKIWPLFGHTIVKFDHFLANLATFKKIWPPALKFGHYGQKMATLARFPGHNFKSYHKNRKKLSFLLKFSENTGGEGTLMSKSYHKCVVDKKKSYHKVSKVITNDNMLSHLANLTLAMLDASVASAFRRVRCTCALKIIISNARSTKIVTLNGLGSQERQLKLKTKQTLS